MSVAPRIIKKQDDAAIDMAARVAGAALTANPGHRDHPVHPETRVYFPNEPEASRFRKVYAVSTGSYGTSGNRKFTIEMPTEGIAQKNTCRIVIPSTLAISANQAAWARGEAGACLQRLKVSIGKRTVSDIDYYGILAVKKRKFDYANQNTLAKSAVIGYYASQTDVAAAEQDFIIEFVPMHILNQSIPLFMLDNSSKVKIEFEIGSDTNVYTATNTGTNARTLTINSPYLIYREENSDAAKDAYRQGQGLHFLDFTGEKKVVPVSTTSVTLDHRHSGGRFMGAEVYSMHNADEVSHTEHNKLWYDNPNDLTEVKVEYQNRQILIDSNIEKPKGSEAWLLNELWSASASDSKTSYSPSISSWGGADGDWRLAIPISALPHRQGHAGYKQDRNLTLTLSYSTTSEALNLYPFYVTSKTIHFSGNGRVKVDELVLV